MTTQPADGDVIAEMLNDPESKPSDRATTAEERLILRTYRAIGVKGPGQKSDTQYQVRRAMMALFLCRLNFAADVVDLSFHINVEQADERTEVAAWCWNRSDELLDEAGLGKSD